MYLSLRPLHFFLIYHWGVLTWSTDLKIWFIMILIVKAHRRITSKFFHTYDFSKKYPTKNFLKVFLWKRKFLEFFSLFFLSKIHFKSLFWNICIHLWMRSICPSYELNHQALFLHIFLKFYIMFAGHLSR